MVSYKVWGHKKLRSLAPFTPNINESLQSNFTWSKDWFLISASILNAIYFRSQLEILNTWKEMESKSLASTTTTTTACTLPSSSIRPIHSLSTASHSIGSTLSPTISPISPIKSNLSPITGLRNEMLNSLNTVASVYQKQEPKFNFHKLAESATKDKIKKKTRPKKEYICRWISIFRWI